MADYLSTEELAERYAVPLKTIYMWNHRGTGPKYLRLGGSNGRSVRYRLADVVAWERACEVDPEHAA